MSVSGKRVASSLLAILLVSILAYTAFPSQAAFADQITARTLTLQGVGLVGGSQPSGTVNHQFTFTLPNVGGGNIGSIIFLYCTTAGNLSDPCTPPTGLDTTGASLGTSTGAAFTSVSHTSANSIYISRTAASVTPGQAVVEQLAGVVNPSAVNGVTFYVRIASYVSTNTTGSPVDTGTVAAATNRQIILTGTMPESLIFCTGGTVGTTSSIPDCSTATSGAVTFNQLFSPTDTATATSQMAASTNAGAGYSITVNGTTMTSGSNTITAMSGGLGVRGTSQFGMNLRANTTTTSTPAVGTDVAPAANGTNYRGEAVSGYNTIDSFKFVTGNSVADSANGGAGPTDAQIFTASYIVNVSGSQAAGTYTTTLTYICTATY